MRPLILTDFDGVINPLPPSMSTAPTPADPTTGFHADQHTRVTLGDGRHVTVTWSSELVRRLTAVQQIADLAWLSTWQPDTRLLNRLFDWHDVTTINWYDPVSGHGLWTGKFDHIRSRLRVQPERPLIWIDDEEVDDDHETTVTGMRFAHLMMIRPDRRIGISKRQMSMIDAFLMNPTAAPRLTVDYEVAEAFAVRHGRRP